MKIPTSSQLSLIVAGGLLAVTLSVPGATAFDEVAITTPGTSVAPLPALSVSRMATMKARADQEIKRRLTALNALSTRVQAMARITDTQKASIAAEVQSEVSSLTALQVKVDAETDSAALRADVTALIEAYRIFALVLPRGRIVVAADRITTVASSFTAMGAKFESRLDAAREAHIDNSALRSAVNDMNNKVADAVVQSQNAVNTVSSLTPDNGDKVKMKANVTALQAARTSLKNAWQDLIAAQQDARTIILGLKAMRLSAGTTPTPL